MAACSNTFVAADYSHQPDCGKCTPRSHLRALVPLYKYTNSSSEFRCDIG